MSIKKIGIAALAAGVIGAGALAFSADAAQTAATPPAPGSITGYMVKDGTLYGADLNPAVVKWFTGTWNNTVVSDSVKDGALQEKDFSAAVQSKLNSGGGTKGDKGDTGATGAAGKDGKDGVDAIVSVTAMTQLTDRPDSGHNGNWAKDTITRSATVTKQSAVDAAKCGPTATECYFYTGNIMDNGTFETIPGAKSPQAGDVIAGIVNGTIVGVSKFQFYATSGTPKPELVPATSAGAAIGTARWGALFFPAGTNVTDLDQRGWGWTYQANATCEEWVNSNTGDSGDITGVNGC